MYQSVLLDSYIDKSAESSYIGDYSRKFHTRLKIIDGPDIVRKFKFLHRFTRVSSGFAQLIDDVIDGGKSYLA